MWEFKSDLIWEPTGASILCIPLKSKYMVGGVHP